jgi:uncharacterized protein
MRLRLDVSGLEREVGSEMRFKLAGEMADEPLHDEGEVRFGPVEVEGRALWTDGTILVEARATSPGALTCSRCLAEISIPISAEFAQEYLPAEDGQGGMRPAMETRRRRGGSRRRRETRQDEGSGAPAAEDGEGGCLLPEEPIPFSGDDLDLTAPVRESLLLELPMKPVCREDCVGLCPVCGANLNLERCGCRAETADPRLVSLKRLLEAKERGE